MNKEKISKKPKHLTVKEFAVELLSQANNANEQEAKIIIFAGEGSRYEVTVKSDDAMEDGNIIFHAEQFIREDEWFDAKEGFTLEDAHLEDYIKMKDKWGDEAAAAAEKKEMKEVKHEQQNN